MTPKAPRTRGDCPLERPCPHFRCRYHMFEAWRLHVGWSASELTETCALDVADRGPATLNEIAQMWGISRERVRQLEASALRKLARMDEDHLPRPQEFPPAPEPSGVADIYWGKVEDA